MLSLIPIAMLAALGLLMVRLLATGAAIWFEENERAPVAAVAAGVWIPAALVLPLLPRIAQVDGTVWPSGAVPLTGGVAIGWIGLGVAIACRTVSPSDFSRGRDTRVAEVLIPGLVGAVLLMLAAAERLHVSIGQVMFALGAVVLWLNVPDEPAGDVERTAILDRSRGLATIAMIGLGQAACMWWASGAWEWVCGSFLIVQSSIVLAVVARRGFPRSSEHIGLWTAVGATLFGVGLLSVVTIARSTGLIGGQDDAELALRLEYGIARGFSNFAPEGAALMALPAAGLIARSVRHPWVRRVLGAAAVLVGAALWGWRMLAVAPG